MMDVLAFLAQRVGFLTESACFLLDVLRHGDADRDAAVEGIVRRMFGVFGMFQMLFGWGAHSSRGKRVRWEFSSVPALGRASVVEDETHRGGKFPNLPIRNRQVRKLAAT